MSNIRFELSKLEIDEIIEDSLKIYPPDLNFYKQEISISKQNFIFKCYTNYHELNISKYSMIRYMCVFNGYFIYDFYVVNTIKKSIENIFPV